MLPIIPIQKRLRIKPTFAISTCLTWPVANTIAFGGVAIGNIKAQLAPQAMMAARAIGGKFKVCATEITIGIINAALAVLEVNSVRNMMNALTTKHSTHSGFSLVNCTMVSAMILLAPESFMTILKVNPPPKSINTPHSTRC